MKSFCSIPTDASDTSTDTIDTTETVLMYISRIQTLL